MKVEKANKEDHQVLTEITKKSKAFWGYSEQQMILWNDALTISEDQIESQFIYKLAHENQIIGYYSYYFKTEKIIKLDNLFLLPEFIGKGIGNQLMTDFLNRIKEITTIKKVLLDADPNAEKFYQKFGFNTIGQLETSIKNRFLPQMELNL
jgi:N-acetylglutamate synthase-like GNAT family acetyltransferase